MPHLAMLGVGCPLWVGASANVPNFQGHPPQVPKSHWTGMPTAQRRQKITKMLVVTKNSQLQGPSGKEVLTPCSNQLQKPARNTCGHALARFWWPGPVQQVRGLAWWVPPGLAHFFGLGNILQKFPSLGGQHATLPICLPPKLGAP